MSIHISDEQKSLFRDEGYMILESIIPNELLTLLQDECQGQIDRMNRRMDEEGTDVIGINHRNKRYFV